ncbi:RagB/SusD family nutrient uptake outer membrane protein [Flavitalea sp. BT771]|uniref:RagB/SusD family nutrient uptake outer membrane protein n=1 Tax=Flavitalea sp. BT771 TaxID=3063329 RepID=UPI0026E29B38|nr:RagB/SusD family nutrient uptake outer membrane protein [Flavitalea sp. BT771]MDO6430056.1 RagB/SusD family nutrient uptake outer membrane protein [Flavitalea sp. BT771]MDV6219805.1 RagB/SusD family nutrient uptake outer membrane protein [Flavitalea sp. BT771]
MNRKQIINIMLAGIFLSAGCKKYLQVQPTGAYTEVQVFSNKSAAQQALNGLYIGLASNDLYGAALTQTYIELMAQRYRALVDGVNFYEQYQQNNYNAKQAQDVFNTIWKSAYQTIMSANLFLEKIEGSIKDRVVSEDQGKLMKGEALAVRALLHFDMMRLFGPVYSLGENQQAVPYYTVADGTAQPILTSAEGVERVVQDLTAAESLLADDAIIRSGIINDPDFYTGHRNQRMNYFAVKALKARVYLWGNKTTEAHDAALAVLTQGEQWFPWLPYTSIINSSTPDRIFSTELLFALYNRNLYKNYATFFSPALTDTRLLAPDAANLRTTFENNENDWRYPTTWRQTTRSFRTFFKYEDVSLSQPWAFLQPMIRKSELYYILAETETDPVKARNYIDSVRTHRGLPGLAANASMPAELLKEYRKEFYGEGQLFFYYKRTNTPSIPDAMTNASRVPVYVVPLPLSETTPR